jgi:hypothetical protein
MKTSELTGVALDAAVAKCEGVAVEYVDDGITRCLLMRAGSRFNPSSKWDWGGPIIEREKIDVIADPNGKDVWMGRLYQNHQARKAFGATPLIAAMRCYVASKLGDNL